MTTRGGTDYLFALCDISGYTRFMTQHREALFHAYVIVSELMRAVLRQSKPPLRVMKLEGDALFLYARQDGAVEERQQTARAAIQRLDGAFAAFAAKRQELIESNICPCEACESVDELRLKVILHAGPAILHRIGRHPELAGADVILAHRLLKNSVDANEYLLLTEAVRHALGPAEREPWITAEEHYDGFDPVRTFIYRPPAGAADPAPAGYYATTWLKTCNILRKIFRGRLMQFRLLPRRFYHHLGATGRETGPAPPYSASL